MIFNLIAFNFAGSNIFGVDAAYSSITLTPNVATTFDLSATVSATGASDGECVIAKLENPKDHKDSTLETYIKATADGAVSYVAIMVPELREKPLYNSPEVIFASNSSCWATASDVGTSGLVSSTDASQGGGSPAVKDLTTTNDEFANEKGAVYVTGMSHDKVSNCSE